LKTVSTDPISSACRLGAKVIKSNDNIKKFMRVFCLQNTSSQK
ncbi:uncharacterized protein METZ01_LOCUS414948, partial [marine metagenome]